MMTEYKTGYPILETRGTRPDQLRKLESDEREIHALIGEHNPHFANSHTRDLASRIELFRLDNLHRGGETAAMAEWLEKYRPGTYPHS